LALIISAVRASRPRLASSTARGGSDRARTPQSHHQCCAGVAFKSESWNQSLECVAQKSQGHPIAQLQFLTYSALKRHSVGIVFTPHCEESIAQSNCSAGPRCQLPRCQ
jgi:hypothetical protein